MLLRIESRPVGDVLVMQLHGRIVAGNEVFTLHAKVVDAIEKYGDVVLQMDQVEFVDSSGLGAMMRLVQAARPKAGDVKLSGLPPNIRKVLQLTNLLQQFEATTRSKKPLPPHTSVRAIRAARPATHARGCCACIPQPMCACSCAKCFAAPATTP